jgi:hypothetical protein
MDKIYCSEECKLIHESEMVRIAQLEKAVSDFAQRFDTLQTPLWKRIIFWIDGWPWHDLNGQQKKRFWHGDDLNGN